jgi:hypothetical protein
VVRDKRESLFGSLIRGRSHGARVSPRHPHGTPPSHPGPRFRIPAQAASLHFKSVLFLVHSSHLTPVYAPTASGTACRGNNNNRGLVNDQTRVPSRDFRARAYRAERLDKSRLLRLPCDRRGWNKLSRCHPSSFQEARPSRNLSLPINPVSSD